MNATPPFSTPSEPIEQEQLEEAVQAILSGQSTLQELKGVTDAQLEAVYSIGFNHYQADQFAEAIPIFSWLCMFNPFQPKFWMGLGAALQMNKSFEEAINAYGFATMTGDSQDPEPYFRIGEACISLGRKQEALAAFADVERYSRDRPHYQTINERARALSSLLQENAA